MAKGALKTFFRQDAGFPEDEPDLTDFLLDSMIQPGRRPRTDMYGSPAPFSTSASRVSGMAAMGGMRGPQGQQGPPGPTAPQPTRQGGMFNSMFPPQLPGMLGQMQHPDVTVPGGPYPAMPGPMAAPSPMPQMGKPGWMDFLSQAGGGIADAMNARGGRRTNWFGQIGGQQQQGRDREFQQAMADRGAMENAARMAHEYDWRKYGAGRQEARQDSLDSRHADDVKFRDKLLAQQQEQAGWAGKLQSQLLPMQFQQAETSEDLDKLIQKALLETGGNPELMKQVLDAAKPFKTAFEYQRVGGGWFADPPPSPNGPQAPKGAGPRYGQGPR